MYTNTNNGKIAKNRKYKIVYSCDLWIIILQNVNHILPEKIEKETKYGIVTTQNVSKQTSPNYCWIWFLDEIKDFQLEYHYLKWILRSVELTIIIVTDYVWHTPLDSMLYSIKI